MATTDNKKILSIIATASSRLSDLPIKNGQLLFIRDKQKIAMDYDGKRTFYNQIELLESESERQELTNPVNGLFYFVIGTAILWTYQNDNWIQITSKPEEVVFIGIKFPELGRENTLYVNKSEKHISVWDDSSQDYIEVANKTDAITDEEILSLFTTEYSK